MNIRGNSGPRREHGAAIRTAFLAFLGIISLLVTGCATNRDVLLPRCVNSPVLDYPPEAILKGQSGKLEVVLHLQEDGTVDEMHIHQSTGVPVLDDAGMEFVESLEFLPLVANGRKQPCWVEQTVIFTLGKPPLDPFQWRLTTRRLVNELEETNPEEQTVIQRRLYNQCSDYMSHMIIHQDLAMNRMALNSVMPPLREKWGPYKKTFPMSFLMFADYVARIKDSPNHERALVQLKQSIEVDIHLIEQSLRSRDNPALSQMREDLRDFLTELQ
jgi:TonB family protein